ncbi:MAG: ComEC/Rec2 family competence protein [Chloroflexota bacterium]|jgi:competence protein ComEC
MRRRRPFPLLVSLVLLVMVALVAIDRVAPPGFGQPTPGPVSSELLIAVLDVGQADSIFIRSSSGRTMLVDAGNEKADVERVILPYLRYRGVSSLDYLVLTHPDQDHVGGMPALLDSFPVSTFIDPVHPEETNRTYYHTLERVQSKNIKAVKARRGQTEIDLGPDIVVQTLAPEDPLITDAQSFNNANSVVLRITLGSVSALLTGDIEEKTEERLLGHRDTIQSQILKVAHHGSRYGSIDPFLDAVQPEIALISAGDGNSYGHPHRELLQRLESRQIKTYRTDKNGTIEVTTDGREYRVTTEKAGG